MVKTVRGREINLTDLMHKNEDTVALGNARMNARGDILGKGGKVVKTREELATEYHTKNPNAVKNVALSEPLPEMIKPAPKTVAPKLDGAKSKKNKNEEAIVSEEENKDAE